MKGLVESQRKPRLTDSITNQLVVYLSPSQPIDDAYCGVSIILIVHYEHTVNHQ